jgi:hypothetical protein
MTYLTFASLATASLVCILSISVVRVFRAIIHEQQRALAEAHNQIMHLAGRTWTAPPADEQPLGILERELQLADVDQEPDY